MMENEVNYNVDQQTIDPSVKSIGRIYKEIDSLIKSMQLLVNEGGKDYALIHCLYCLKVSRHVLIERNKLNNNSFK